MNALEYQRDIEQRLSILIKKYEHLLLLTQSVEDSVLIEQSIQTLKALMVQVLFSGTAVEDPFPQI